MTPRTITYNFHRFVELVLRDSEYIELPLEEALELFEQDKTEAFYHIEIPSSTNRIPAARLWNLRAWASSYEKREEAKLRAEQSRVEFDNLKRNIVAVAIKLSSHIGNDPQQLVNLAQSLIRKSPGLCKTMGVELREPYYKGLYEYIPEYKSDYEQEFWKHLNRR